MPIFVNGMFLTAAVKAFAISFYFCFSLGSKNTGPDLFYTQTNITHLSDNCKTIPGFIFYAYKTT